MDHIILEEHRLKKTYLDGTPDWIEVLQIVTDGEGQFRYLLFSGTWGKEFTLASTDLPNHYSARKVMLQKKAMLIEDRWKELDDYKIVFQKVRSLHQQQQDAFLLSNTNIVVCPTPEPGAPVILIQCSRLQHDQSDPLRVWCGRVVSEHGKFRVETFEGPFGAILDQTVSEPMVRFTDAEMHLFEQTDLLESRGYDRRWDMRDRTFGEYPVTPIPTPDPIQAFGKDPLNDPSAATSWFI